MASAPFALTLDDLESAVSRVRRDLPETPQYRWPLLDARTGVETWVKHENHLPTGAFKVRGGLVYVDALIANGAPAAGIVCATRGNHGQSAAYAARAAGIGCTIVVPHGNSTEKNAAMRGWGAALIEHGEDFEAALAHARELAATRDLHMMPSFARDLVRGVGTWALELLRAVPDLQTLYVPVGLGSGICGAIAARDLLGSRAEIVGVQSAGAAAYARSLEAGRVVSLERSATHADGIAVRVPDAQAFEMIRRGAARIVTVSDDDIAAAIRAYWTDTHNLAEGAGAAPLAGLLRERDAMRGRRTAVVLCGGNIDMALFRRWVLGQPSAG